MTRDERILLGTIAKTHGVHGELILRTPDPSVQPDEDLESVFLLIEGIQVPFFIASLRESGRGEWVLKLDWYDTRDRAETLVGYTVWVPSQKIQRDEEGWDPQEFEGFGFLDRNSGRKGRITGVMDIPGNPVFELECEGEKKLVPANAEFILEADTARRLIVFDLPGGLV